MNGTEALTQTLTDLSCFFEGRSWKYCLIGALAANRWGRPRFTGDVDITVLARIGDEEAIVDALLAAFRSRLDLSDARQFALDNRVLLLISQSGIDIDIALGALAFEEHMLDRAIPYDVLPGIRLPVATAEDVVIMKTVAGRPQDWLDIEGVLAKQRNKLDWKHIDGTLSSLLELAEAPERAAQLAAVKQKIDAAAASRKKS
jgi:nucleotidyltransferase AbiEii toxin of type IV toxin-antitoxin system